MGCKSPVGVTDLSSEKFHDAGINTSRRQVASQRGAVRSVDADVLLETVATDAHDGALPSGTGSGQARGDPDGGQG